MVKKLDWDTKLKSSLKRDNASCNFDFKNLSRDDKIKFVCNCGNEHTAEVRRICDTTGAFCGTCTHKRSREKIEKTNMEKFGTKCNLQKTSPESEQKRKDKLKKNHEEENKKDKICQKCNNTFHSTSPKSTICRPCQTSNNVNKRKENKSKCIIEAVRQLKVKYPEITNPQLLVDKFHSQNGSCHWCNCILVCPKVNGNYQDNYNQPSLDRINNEDNHNVDNVNITCHMCNIMRGETDYKIFSDIINILRGDKNTLDLSNHEFINKLTDKRFTIGYNRVKEIITCENLRELSCPITNFPIFLGKNNHYPLLPSWDRKTNNDEYGNKMDHNDENIQMVCAFMNMARNKINKIEDFINIFNEKFPNRIKDIKVIYPEDYIYISKYDCFVNKKYAESNLWQGGPMTSKQLFKNRVKRIILNINQVKQVNKWCNENKRLPKHTNGKAELRIYRLLSYLKSKKIYNHLLISEYISDLRTNKEKINEDWMIMYNKLKEYTEINNELPINTCNDKKLYYWMSTQKKKYKNNELSEEEIYKLNKIQGWWWTEIHRGYLNNKPWFDNNHCIIPKKDEHGPVYLWYAKIKKYYLLPKHDKCSLSDYEINLIKTIPIIDEWINYECPMNKKDKNYKVFYKKYQHPNSIVERDSKGHIISK